MVTLPVSEDDLRKTVEIVMECGGNVTAAAGRMKLARSTVQNRIRLAERSKIRAKRKIRVKAGTAEIEEKPLFRNPPPLPAFVHGARFKFETDDDHTFTFGALGDTHLCSKYERLDVLESLYDIFEEEGITTVFHTGNWIDGEAPFNVHDLTVRGMDAQVRYLAKKYPKREGVTTYAVTGDDHEGWYAARTGVDIGDYAERAFRQADRTDWINLGYMEAPVLLEDRQSGAISTISVVHPGGGSAYAVSYTMQKFIEALDGGEKPAILLAGHYHKLWFGNIRNVWAIQTGATQDQTPFMRKKKIDAHIGGTIVRATVDPDTGAVTRCRVELLRYFNRGYYAGRWSHSGAVQLPARSWAGV